MIAPLGLRVIREDVRHSNGLLGVVDIEDRAMLVVDFRLVGTLVGVSRLQVKSISATRAILQIVKAIHERHVEKVAVVCEAWTALLLVPDLVFQLSDILSTACLVLGQFDRDATIRSALPELF